jgi:hypothetical protein
VLTERTDLRWVDYWGSRDPAPSGSLDPPGTDLEPPSERFINMPIWNLLSFREDHGTYWDNDEEFVIPLLQRLESEDRRKKSFFGDDESHRTRSNRRRRRVSVLSVWRQLCLMAPMAAIITSFVAGKDLIPRIGDSLAGAWAVVPGSQLVTAPLDAIRALNLESIGPIDTLAEVGVWVVAALIAIAAAFALISPPERATPWTVAESTSSRVIAWLVRLGPILVAAPLVVLLLTAAAQFAGGASPTGVAAIGGALVWVAVGAVAVGIAYVVSRHSLGVRIAATVIVLALGSLLVLAPIAAILIFPAVGRMVLGSVAVVIGFGIVARLGRWRWSAWDLRERLASHARKPEYQSITPVAAQCVVLLLAVAAFFLAVSFELGWAAAIGVGLAVFAVLAGIAIDVNGPSQKETRTAARTSFDSYANQVRR